MILSNSKLAFGLGTAFSALSAALAVSCGDEFSDCTASRTCPGNAGGAGGEAAVSGNGGKAGNAGSSGGTAGSGGQAAAGGSDSGGQGGETDAGDAGRGAEGPSDGGEAGEAGGGGHAEQPTTCDRDRDCNDGNACDGAESCEAGSCVEGKPVTCTNEEPTECDVSCETIEGVASCGHVGRDADLDGFKSAACTADPGDDCNDTNAAIHPGAAEMCDGVDSDCDELADTREAEVKISGELDVLVTANESSPELGAFNIAGHGETTTTAVAPFALAWIEDTDTCRRWQTHSINHDGIKSPVASSECDERLVDTIDVTARPTLTTMTTRGTGPQTPATFFTLLTDASGERLEALFATRLLPPVHQALSFNGSEYRIVRLSGMATTTIVRRLGFNRDFELTRDDELDPAAEHLALDGEHGAAVWTLRTSPTLDQVFGDLGDGPTLLSDTTTSASHPLMAWSENHGNGIAWRYADGAMKFKHYEGSCAVTVGRGFPGELAATAKGFVLISLSEDKDEVVATLIEPDCELGPRTVLARADGDTLSEPKIAVTGREVRALWKRTSDAGGALESRQFRWEGCE
jgi:hypothetical protein